MRQLVIWVKDSTEPTNRSIDVAVSFSEGNLNSLLNLMRLGLPCSKSDCWDLSPGVESISLSGSEEL
jgi:hypothetical protein